MMPRLVGLMKFILNVFVQVIFKGESSIDVIFTKYTFHIVICEGILEPICFKLGMMLGTTNFYSLIPV